jgi:hypothetical protein
MEFHSRLPPFVWFIIQGISSIGLTILNKQLNYVLHSPFLILIVQNFVSICAYLICCSFGLFKFPTNTSYKAYFTLLGPTCLYILLLWSSLEGLTIASVALVVVFRNAVPILTSLMDNTKKKDVYSIASLLLVFVSSIFCMYSKGNS